MLNALRHLVIRHIQVTCILSHELGVLNALRHLVIRHGTGVREVVDETTVLNALRHLVIRHVVRRLLSRLARLCSTPYGIW